MSLATDLAAATDDRLELLLNLSPSVPVDGPTFMREHGWCGDRFAAAVRGIRVNLRIALSTGDTGETITVRRRHWIAAQDACERYLARASLN